MASTALRLFSPLLLALVLACGDDASGDTSGASGQDGSDAGSGGAAGKGGSAGKAGAGAGGSAGQAGAAGAGAGGAGAAGVAGQAGQAGAGAAGAAGEAGAAGSAGQAGGAAGQGGAGAAGAGPGCEETCTAPGFACVNGACVEDCRKPSAKACEQGKVCNLAEKPGGALAGKCVDPNGACVLHGFAVQCGSKVCGPGTTCSPKGECLAELPCQAMVCEGDQCWGEQCPCERPAGTCTPAKVGAPGEAGTLNDPTFIGGGTGEGLSDIDFDDKCTIWASSFVSGPDSLRSMTSDGVMVPPVVGVTNLNMGEVAVRNSKEQADVAITYNCCETCGCILSGSNGNPQGAALLDPSTSPPGLPMKIPTIKFSSGPGPFGNKGLDTGPMGLAWGFDYVLYLGNVETNGDFVALDLSVEGSKNVVVTTFPKRVHAAAPFDAHRLLVAVEGGAVYLVPILGVAGEPKILIQLPTHVTSLLRDPWSGRIYASLNDKTIQSFKADGSDLQLFEVTDKLGRIALGPDGFLYHLAVYPAAKEIARFPMPSSF